MNIYRLTTEELEQEVTNVKNLIVSYLDVNKYISKEVANNLIYNYGIIIRKPSFFTRLWKKKNTGTQEVQYVIVKQLTILEKNLKNKNPKSNLTLLKTESPTEDKDK